MVFGRVPSAKAKVERLPSTSNYFISLLFSLTTDTVPPVTGVFINTQLRCSSVHNFLYKFLHTKTAIANAIHKITILMCNLHSLALGFYPRAAFEFFFAFFQLFSIIRLYFLRIKSQKGATRFKMLDKDFA